MSKRLPHDTRRSGVDGAHRSRHDAYQKGHARKVVRVEMMLPYHVHVPKRDDFVRQERAVYRVSVSPEPQRIFSRISLRENRRAAQVTIHKGILERETRLELATPTLARPEICPEQSTAILENCCKYRVFLSGCR